MATFFSDFFKTETQVIEEFGAYDVSLLTDLPLFIDPFLLFNSKKAEYRDLHGQVIDYLVFLKGKADAGIVDDALLHAWYCFPEVKQTWLGFTVGGNEGHGLGMDFARALHGSLTDIFRDFGQERVTKGNHLEKVCLIKEGVGRDNISDFTTNLIKDFLYRYTEGFAAKHLKDEQVKTVPIRNAIFNYETESWETRDYILPWVRHDHVVLVPKDLLTRDETWINKADLIRGFRDIPPAIPDKSLRAQVNNYFERALARRRDREPNQKERDEAAIRTIKEFPVVIDYFILKKEIQGSEASNISKDRVRFAEAIFNFNIAGMQLLLEKSDFYKTPANTYDESLQRVTYLKHVIEDQGGHRMFYKDGRPIRYEKDLQIMFRLVWFGTPSDVSAEVNDGRGPADFKISRGAKDKTIVEMKLASNTSLRKNLAAQAEIYQKASDAKSAIKVIVYFTDRERLKVKHILKTLQLEAKENIVLIDARDDNKPSASKAEAA